MVCNTAGHTSSMLSDCRSCFIKASSISVEARRVDVVAGQVVALDSSFTWETGSQTYVVGVQHLQVHKPHLGVETTCHPWQLVMLPANAFSCGIGQSHCLQQLLSSRIWIQMLQACDDAPLEEHA